MDTPDNQERNLIFNDWKPGQLHSIGFDLGLSYIINKNFSAGISYTRLFFQHEASYGQTEPVKIYTDTAVYFTEATLNQFTDIQSALNLFSLTGRYTLNPHGILQGFVEASIGKGFFKQGSHFSAWYETEPVFMDGNYYHSEVIHDYNGNSVPYEELIYKNEIKESMTFGLKAGASLKIVQDVNFTLGVGYVQTGIRYDVVSEIFTRDDKLIHTQIQPFDLNLLQPFGGIEIYFGKGSVRHTPNSKSRTK